jgi:predicted phosphodiesterase
VQVRDGVIYFNPGSAGPRRFSLPVTLGFVTVEDGVEASVMELDVK